MNKINEKIKEQARIKGISLPKLASMINISKQSLYHMLNVDDYRASRLKQISAALNHNFFQYYITSSTKKEKQLSKLQEENKILSLKVTYLEKENKHLQEIIDLLKASKT